MIIKTKLSYAKIKIHIPTKLIRDGIKVNALCDSKTKYLYAFHVYTESQTDLIKVELKMTNLFTTLVNKLLFKRFHIFIDNYYLSVLTFCYLYNIRHNTIRIIHLNRICKELHMKKSIIKKTI
jgi:hypothetical protein